MKKILIPVFFGLLGGGIAHIGLDLLKAEKAPEMTSGAYAMSGEYTGNKAIPAMSLEKMEELNGDFVGASSTATQSVVYITTISESRRSVSWMDWFFGGGSPQQVINSGSGVIFTADGYVVTNNHVIDQAKSITVMAGKRQYGASVVGTDPSTDLAVLKIEGGKFPAIQKGSSKSLNVGEWVLAVGNPFNLNSTVTAGIVSAKGRDIGIVRDQFPLESFIQTDAAINPGNSGGALVNLKGELVGINTAIISKTGYYTGYGFAVPVDIVKKVVDDLIQYGKVQKAFIEAEVTDLDFELAEKLEIEDLEGVVITHLHEGGAAEKAGLERGDIILKVNGDQISTKANFDESISYLNPGEKITVQVKRDNKLLDKHLMLRNENGTTEVLINETVRSATLGAEFEELSKQEKELYGISGGVIISNIKGGMLNRIGVDEGFILMSVNDEVITTADQAIKVLENARGHVILKGVTRSGVSGYYSYYY